jgi:hypothetical protein
MFSSLNIVKALGAGLSPRRNIRIDYTVFWAKMQSSREKRNKTEIFSVLYTFTCATKDIQSLCIFIHMLRLRFPASVECLQD